MAGSPVKEGDAIYVAVGRGHYLNYRGTPNRAVVMQANLKETRSGRTVRFHRVVYDSESETQRERKVDDRKGEYLTESEFAQWQAQKEKEKRRYDALNHEKELAAAKVYFDLVTELAPQVPKETRAALAKGLFERYMIYSAESYRVTAGSIINHNALIDELVRRSVSPIVQEAS